MVHPPSPAAALATTPAHLPLCSACLLQQWSTLQALDELDVSGNGLAGAYPESWSALVSLRQLFVNDNKLTGPMPVRPAGLKLANLQVQDNT